MSEAITNNKYFLLILILVITPISGMGIDIYSPSLPAIAHALQTSRSIVQLSIPIFIIGYGIGQIICGSISDAFGRKPMLVVTLIGVIIMSFLLTKVTTASSLLWLRFIQGLFVGGPGVAQKAMLSDSFSGKDLAKNANYVTITWALAPILAPFIGGYIQVYLGWHYTFYTMMIYCVVAFVLSLFVGETIKQKIPLNIANTAHAYKTILSHKVFLLSALLIALVYGTLSLFGVVTPFLIQSVLHFSPITFGHCALAMGAAWLGAQLLNRFLHRKEFSVKTIVGTGLIVLLLTSFVMVLIAFTGHISLAAITVPIFIMIFAGGLVFPNGFSAALSHFRHMGGVAGALMGALFVTGSACISGLASLFPAHDQLPLSLIYLGIAIVCSIIFFAVLKDELVTK